MPSKSLILWGVSLVIVLGILFLAMPETPKDAAETANGKTISVTPLQQGTHFTLTDQTGAVFDTRTQIPEGHYALIYFGFTHCPVVCPTELQKIAAVMDGLPEAVAAKVTPVFITVDPERDNVQFMQEYVPMFHKKLIGLTGDPDTVHQVLDDWNVYYAKVEDPQFTDYTMDHSTYTYLVSHDMKIAALYRMRNSVDDMTDSITKIVQ